MKSCLELVATAAVLTGKEIMEIMEVNILRRLSALKYPQLLKQESMAHRKFGAERTRQLRRHSPAVHTRKIKDSRSQVLFVPVVGEKNISVALRKDVQPL